MGKGSFRKHLASGGQVVYGDVDVCRLLGIRRRVLAAARTRETRGRDWDCVGRHAGMTKEWIERYALEHHIVPKYTNFTLHPIADGDKVVSCKLLNTWPNRTRVTVEVVATGEARVATVRNADEFNLYEIFDAVDYGSEIAWRADLNAVRY